MRRARSLWTLGLFVAVGATAVEGADKADSVAKDLWDTHCTLCHGDRGAPPEVAKKMGVADLSLAKWQASRTDDQIREVIAEGKPDTLMRGFQDDLSVAEIEALVKHVRALAAKPAKKPAP